MKKIATALLAALLIAPAAALSQAYTQINPPLPVEAEGSKIEVLEFFSYACIHCYSLEPALEGWLKKLPADVQFRRVPAVFNDRMLQEAATFYAFEALGVLDKVHRPFFDAIHRDRLRTSDPAVLADWLQKQGIDPKKFTDVRGSFSVQSKAKRAARLTATYKIDGTPQMAVHGRYTVSAEQAQTQQGMLQAVSNLIDSVRKQKK